MSFQATAVVHVQKKPVHADSMLREIFTNDPRGDFKLNAKAALKLAVFILSGVGAVFLILAAIRDLGVACSESRNFVPIVAKQNAPLVLAAPQLDPFLEIPQDFVFPNFEDFPDAVFMREFAQLNRLARKFEDQENETSTLMDEFNRQVKKVASAFVCKVKSEQLTFPQQLQLLQQQFLGSQGNHRLYFDDTVVDGVDLFLEGRLGEDFVLFSLHNEILSQYLLSVFEKRLETEHLLESLKSLYFPSIEEQAHDFKERVKASLFFKILERAVLDCYNRGEELLNIISELEKGGLVDDLPLFKRVCLEKLLNQMKEDLNDPNVNAEHMKERFIMLERELKPLISEDDDELIALSEELIQRKPEPVQSTVAEVASLFYKTVSNFFSSGVLRVAESLSSYINIV